MKEEIKDEDVVLFFLDVGLIVWPDG